MIMVVLQNILFLDFFAFTMASPEGYSVNTDNDACCRDARQRVQSRGAEQAVLSVLGLP